jgi:hypothetical protein
VEMKKEKILMEIPLPYQSFITDLADMPLQRSLSKAPDRTRFQPLRLPFRARCILLILFRGDALSGKGRSLSTGAW